MYCFDAAMSKGDFRWGAEAKLVSAISVAISMMESKKLDVIPSIARLLNEDVPKLLKMWTRVVDTLDIQLRPTSFLLVLEALRGWIDDCLRGPYSHPQILLNTFTQPNQTLESVFEMARAIDAFFQTQNSTPRDPAASTACATLILAVESDRGSPFQSSDLTNLAKTLGGRAGAYFTRTLDCRREMMVVFEDWAKALPWSPNFRVTEEERIWAAPRQAAVIRVLSDVLQFQNELRELRRAKGLDNLDPPQTGLSPTSEESALDPYIRWAPPKVAKRARAGQAAQRVVDQLLNPKSTVTMPRSLKSSQEDVFERLCRIELQVLHGVNQPLTRLQALCLRRGGESNVIDEELFEPGELESYQNGEEVAQYLGAIHPEWFEGTAGPGSHGSGVAMNQEEESGLTRSTANHGLGVMSNVTEGESIDEADHEAEREGEFSLERHSYMALGVLGDYEGSDIDTARFFGTNLES
ncbi:hypothetical protein FRC15_007699 [Serendipita sp. 397]|nr:hypothetical protein FRC15_007699 [Serendipita sp. 397]